jgi:hypothetical protein
VQQQELLLRAAATAGEGAVVVADVLMCCQSADVLSTGALVRPGGSYTSSHAGCCSYSGSGAVKHTVW